MNNTKRKLLIISLLTIIAIIIFLKVSENIVVQILLPALVGIIYSPRIGELSSPILSEKMMSLFILLLPLIALLIVMPISSAFAYLGGILASRLFKELMVKINLSV
ncbi:hypothetical protein [Facklamia sp. 7083-14-GEN3]|uniref:hypothetical protein n=1 Tax=Facklamia sp. 7083-14-GEN3 TaxID=2973478 RepID=UPI00215BC21B|nr:hypothetical protein [Facklamia sp. 7083-14-GEN3]MCR8968756.1 hypothetical protein [Facklamia sp. 7083-14-GEN3]